MDKKAVVTGACGFVGSHLVEYLEKRGWEIIGTDLEKAQRNTYYADRPSEDEKMPQPSYYGDFIDDLDASFIPADITDEDTLRPVFEPDVDVVFHTASLYDYFAEWDELKAVNVDGGGNVGRLAVEYDVDHFIHWSTLGVTGGNDVSKDNPIKEDAPYAPHNRYCRSKVKQEGVLLKLQEESDLPLTILRPAPIYGPRNKYGVYHLLYLYRKIGTGLVFSVYPRRYQTHFPSIHVADLIRAAEFIHTNKKETVGEIYHVTSDPIRQDELVEFVSRILGLPIKRVPLPWSVYRTAASVLVRLAKYLEKRARRQDARPKYPASIAQYLRNDFWFSNEKIRHAGFDFVYRDPKRGLWNYIEWCKERGLI